jgi:signal transduction histidine kinase
MNTQRFFRRTVPLSCAAFFLTAAAVLFAARYVKNGVILPAYFDQAEADNRRLFFINFYIPFTLCAVTMFCCFFSVNFYFRGFCLLLGFSAAAIACYVLDDILTVKLCLYSFFVVITASAFSPPKAAAVSLSAAILFTALQFHPVFLGAALGVLAFPSPALAEILILLLYLSILTAMAVSLRRIFTMYNESEAMVAHLNLVGAQMLLFNHRLQEYAKTQGEEAVRKDRFRFTSDLHDSCGYVFTNIIAISDAAMSQEHIDDEKVRETLNMIQKQARKGLKETREILHVIRELRAPSSRGIDAVYQMKNIFEEVTNIKVEIETGNMRYDYGPTVNLAVSRVIQESFTNSIRHGKATLIRIQFWEFSGYLSMVISDNGVGAEKIVKGIGLAGMEERLAEIGGSLEASSPGDGFRLKVEIPLLGEIPPGRAAPQTAAGVEDYQNA